MPFRNSDREKWKSDLRAAGVDLDSPEIAKAGSKLSVYVFYRMYKLCATTLQFRSAVLRFLGRDPNNTPEGIVPVKKLHQIASKIEHVRQSKRRIADVLTEYERTEVDLSEIGFFSTLPPLDKPSIPSIIDCDGEPLPKISRTTFTTPQPHVVPNYENLFRSECKRSQYLEKKCQSVEIKLKEYESVYKTNAELRTELSKAKGVVDKLNYQLTQLEKDLEKAEIFNAPPPIAQEATRHFKLNDSKGAFTSDALILSAQLFVEFQIAEARVGPVISCLANFFGITIDAVPSARTVGRSLHVANAAMSHQVLEIVRNPELEFTLQSDETTKKFNKLQAFVVTYHNNETDELERVFLEVEAVPNKKSQRQLEALQDSVEGMADKVKQSGSEVFNNFVLQVKNLMGDAARTQTKLADLFTKYREVVKRTVDPQFNELPEEEQALFLKTNVFFCFCHLTSNTTPRVLKVLKEDERKKTGKSPGAKSTVEGLLIELARHFGPRTSARYVSVGQWRLYCEMKGIQFGQIESYSKSRFHMIFIIAVRVLMNRDHLISFISNHFDEGEMKEFLLGGLQDETIVSHLMIMAVYELNILGPLWRLAEQSPTPAQSHSWISAILAFFDSVGSNPMLMFSDNSPLDQFEGSKSDEAASKANRKMLETLQPPVGSSVLVAQVVDVLCDYFESRFEYLTDCFGESGDQLKKVPLTNVACESTFSVVDYSFRRQPNMGIRKRATFVALIQNRTFRYLLSKTENERQEILEKSMANRSAVEALERRKSAKYTAELIQDMEAKELERARNKKNIEAKKQKLYDEVQKVGLWKSVAELQAAVSLLKPTKAMAAVKLNLSYRKVHCKGKDFDQKLFKFQQSGHKYNLAELIANLSQVIEMDIEDGPDTTVDDSDVDDFSDFEDE